ncbi:arginase family protein [Sphingosinicella sp. CPCC 101087]|uniref:arginase family protein n=1 Tax=Sphingosinicella sp. CPCC 101087 TaxID=2497754 RepID=UPI00101B8F2A|nr:arginase family protein [Sphingosinicella sp. CPCC 101087]
MSNGNLLPPLGRRTVLAGLATLCAANGRGHADPPRLSLIEAPCNLGLRPPRPRHEPGTWRAPETLREQGLHAALMPASTVRLPRPTYRFEAQDGTRIRNGNELRRFSERLGASVRDALDGGTFPLVIGGDCSILLGCLLGARAAGTVGLLHIDGHSDFFHPENYDTQARLGTAAGMDLALATGRGEPLLASWDGRPLVEDRNVVQLGERDELDPDYAYRDIEETKIRRMPIREMLRSGIGTSVERALSSCGDPGRPLWLHLDLDVLDARVMPAVDSPGSPGLDFHQLATLLAGLLASKRVIGMNVGIYDPDLDPDRRHARAIVASLTQGLAPLRQRTGA